MSKPPRNFRSHRPTAGDIDQIHQKMLMDMTNITVAASCLLEVASYLYWRFDVERSENKYEETSGVPLGKQSLRFPIDEAVRLLTALGLPADPLDKYMADREKHMQHMLQDRRKFVTSTLEEMAKKSGAGAEAGRTLAETLFRMAAQADEAAAPAREDQKP